MQSSCSRNPAGRTSSRPWALHSSTSDGELRYALVERECAAFARLDGRRPTLDSRGPRPKLPDSVRDFRPLGAARTAGDGHNDVLALTRQTALFSRQRCRRRVWHRFTEMTWADLADNHSQRSRTRLLRNQSSAIQKRTQPQFGATWRRCLPSHEGICDLRPDNWTRGTNRARSLHPY